MIIPHPFQNINSVSAAALSGLFSSASGASRPVVPAIWRTTVSFLDGYIDGVLDGGRKREGEGKKDGNNSY